MMDTDFNSNLNTRWEENKKNLVENLDRWIYHNQLLSIIIAVKIGNSTDPTRSIMSWSLSESIQPGSLISEPKKFQSNPAH